MKTTSHPVFSARFGALLGLIGMMTFAPAMAQTIDLVVVEKFSDFRQTDAATTEAAPSPFGFGVFVEGSGLSGIAAPTFTSAAGSVTTGGTLVFESEDDQWDFEQFFADEGSLNTAFADGNYTVNVAGTSVELAQSGSLYPNTPTVTFSQGFWSGGTFFFDPTLDLVITSNVFSDYGSNVDGLIEIYASTNSGPGYNQDVLQFQSDVPLQDFLTLTVDAFDILSGQTLEVEVGFVAIVDTTTDGALPGALLAAVYSTFTTLNLQAIPEPSTSGVLVGVAVMVIGAARRRRC